MEPITLAIAALTAVAGGITAGATGKMGGGRYRSAAMAGAATAAFA